MIFSILINFILIQASFSSVRTEGGDEYPIRCNRNAYVSCVSENRSALNLNQNKRKDSESKIDIYKSRIRTLQTETSSIDENINTISLHIQSSIDEALFLQTKKQEYTVNIPVRVLAETLFEMNADDLFWLENFPDNRLNQLLHTQKKFEQEKLQQHEYRLKIANDIEDYNKNLQQEISVYSSAAYLENTHANMCDTGCREQFCPGE